MLPNTKKFIARVVLHNCADEDYELLHEEMQAAGFSTTIANTMGEFDLPHSEYYKAGSDLMSPNNICLQAKAAARKIVGDRTEASYSVLVTSVEELTWYNLEKALQTV